MECNVSVVNGVLLKVGIDRSMITSSGPISVVILVMNMVFISQLTIHLVYVHPFCVKEVYNTLFIVNLMQQIMYSWY